jgi:hypothetical protein
MCAATGLSEKLEVMKECHPFVLKYSDWPWRQADWAPGCRESPAAAVLLCRW